MKFNLREDIRKTFKIGSDDFKSSLGSIVMVLVVLFVLGGLISVWDFFSSKKSQYEYSICQKGVFAKCVDADRYRLDSSGICVKYWNEKEGTICGEFSIEKNK